jgi:two-component system nitrogen regulation sensor histidine kinase NtrY
VFVNEDLSALLKKSLFSTQVSNTGFDYQLDMPDRPVTFYCDERQISQMMTNLLKNAAESIEARLNQQPDSEKGRISLKLVADGEEIKIIIEDNGMGFPQDMQKMLEPYVTTRPKGTGLGLAIVRKIAEDHKGKIILENIPSGGARVMLSFLQQCDINAAG